jgi:succinyl-diaminopimelate desuccinylase
MRLLPDENPAEAKNELQEFFDRTKERLAINAQLTFTKFDDAYLTPPSSEIVKRFADATAAVFGVPLPLAASLGGDDGKFLFEKGIPVVSYGAIAEDSNFHGKDEFVRLSDLQNVRDVLIRLIG